MAILAIRSRLFCVLMFGCAAGGSVPNLTAGTVSGSAWLSRDQQILTELMRNYDSRVRPPSVPGTNDTAVRVSVNILVRMLSNIDVVDMEYSLQITFREQWLDQRLAYDKMGLSNAPKFLTVPHVKEKLWLPDTFFPTEKSAHRHMVGGGKVEFECCECLACLPQIDTENMFVRVYPNGTVLYSSRLSLICSCPMHLQLYPLDVQHCDFDLISYAFTTRDIIYEWDKNKEPVQLKKGVGHDLPNFLLDEIDTGVECTSHTNTGTYACLRMRMRLSRLMTYFTLQLYLPTSMIVGVSLVSFWIDMHSTAGRVGLAITTLLTITTMQSSINAKLPPVNYVKVVDVWLGACQAFVFCALIEYAVVCYKDTALRNTHRKASELRMAQRRRSVAAAPYHRRTSTAVEMAEHQQWADWERQAEEREIPPCTCELGGIGFAVLASLGIVPPTFSSPLMNTSLLLPLDSVGTAGRRRSVAANLATASDSQANNTGGATHFHVLEMQPKQRTRVWAYLRRKLRKPDYLPARIDWYARIWMPMSFLLFNFCYWSICLGMAAKQRMERK